MRDMADGAQKFMKKIIPVLVMFLPLLITVPLARAQKGKVWRIGFLTPGKAEVYKNRVAAFRGGLRELGYVEGKNVLIEERAAGGRRERLPELAMELVRLKADIIVTHGGRTARVADRAAKEAGRTIPIVFAVSANPEKDGTVASLARPGGNITGLSDSHSDLAAKRLELLKEVVPSVSRVAVLWNPAATLHPPQWRQIQAAAPKLGVTLLSLKVSSPEEFERALDTLRKERPGGLVVLGHSSIAQYRRRYIPFVLENRLPTIHTYWRNVAAGSLMSYGADHEELYRRAATYVDKIFKGAKPADLPVEQPMKFDLVINLKTAKKLGITIPPQVLFRATKVIR